MANLNLGQYVYCNCLLTGFDLTTRDSYFMILVEVFMNHILAENTYFTNHIERREHKILIDDFHHYPFLYQAKVL